MNGNLTYQEEPREELLNGKIYMMSSPTINHSQIASNIYYAFRSYLKGKTCTAFHRSLSPDRWEVCFRWSICTLSWRIKRYGEGTGRNKKRDTGFTLQWFLYFFGRNIPRLILTMKEELRKTKQPVQSVKIT